MFEDWFKIVLAWEKHDMNSPNQTIYSAYIATVLFYHVLQFIKPFADLLVDMHWLDR